MASAAATVSGQVKRLGATSEWMVANTGHSRAQILQSAVKHMVSSVCELISYYDSHLEQSPPSELLVEAQELCVSIADHSVTLPLIEALLQHCHRKRWEFPSSAPFPTAPVSPLSQRFLETITKLSRSGVRLSYKSLVVLWTTHPPALQEELMDIAMEFMKSSSEVTLLACFNCHDLSKACAQSQELFESSKSFLRELAEKDPEKSIVLHIFIQSVNRE